MLRAMMAWYSDLIKDHDAQNWVKAMYSLKITKKGMHGFVKDELGCFHKVIYTKATKGLTEGSYCKECSTNTVKERKKCPNKICQKVRSELLDQHRYRNPSLMNTNADQWWESSWEIGKCFLPRSGYTNKSSIEECDFNGLCSVLSDCKHFWGKLSFDMKDNDKNFLKEILGIVNNRMRHSASLKVTNAELNELLDKLRMLLRDPKELANRDEAKAAIDELYNVQKDDFIVSEDETESILKEDLRLRLASHYRDNLADMAISPILPDRDAKLSMFYVTPKIVEKNHRTPETAGKNVTTYKDLFGVEFKKNNIFLVGEPGRGKSTFSANCALEWSSQHVEMDSQENMQRDTNSFSDTDYFKRVDFLFHIKFRDACHFCDLNEIINDQVIAQIYQPNGVDAGYAVAQNVLENNNCIIIGDGLDEWTHPTDSLTGRPCRCPSDEKGVLPFRNSAIKANVLITTRPWRLSQYRVKDSKIHKYLDINGVSDVHELVDNVLSVMNGETGKKLFKDFFTYVEQLRIDDLLSVPIVTMQLVCMWFDGLALSSSLCDIYATMMDMLFGRFSDHSVKRMNENEMPGLLRKENIMNKHTVVINLCRLAFITLFSQEEKSAVVFENTTVNSAMPEGDKMLSLQSGILTERKSNSYGKRSSHFAFIHKTFQEFLAAVHLFVHEDEYETTVKSRYIGDAGGNVLDISQVFIFICGIKPDLGVQMSSWIGEIIPKTSFLTSDFVSYEYEIPLPDRSTISILQNMIVSGYREAHDDIHLTLTHFWITSSKDVATLKKLMGINKCHVRTLIIAECNDTVSTNDLQEVITSSSKSLTALTLFDRDGKYDLSKCQELEYLRIFGTNTTFEQVDTANLTTCALTNVSINVEQRIMLNCTDRGNKLQHLIINGVKDIQLLCNILPSLSQLQYVCIIETDLRELLFRPPASITLIELRRVTMTVKTLRKMVEEVENIEHTVNCVLIGCLVEPASDVEPIRQYVQNSSVFTLEAYDLSIDEFAKRFGRELKRLNFVFKNAE